jgi:hypothetical protein
MMMTPANLTAGLDGVPLAQLEQRLTDAIASDQPLRVLRLELKIAELKKDEAALKKLRAKAIELAAGARPRQAAKLANAGKAAKVKPIDPEATVREAYLRTLGRRPTDAEADAAREHLAGSVDDAKGLRDLLWALLNTKEFITNH